MGATAPGGATPNTGSAQPSNVNTPAPGGKGGAAQAQPHPQVQQPAPGGKGGQLNPTTSFPGQGGMGGMSGQIPSQYGGFGGMQTPQSAAQAAAMNGMGGKGGQQQGGMMGGSLQGSPYELYAQQLQGTPAGQMPPQQAAMGGKGGMPTSQAQAQAMQQLKDAQAGQIPQQVQQGQQLTPGLSPLTPAQLDQMRMTQSMPPNPQQIQQMQRLGQRRDSYVQNLPQYQELQKMHSGFSQNNLPSAAQQQQMEALQRQITNDPRMQRFDRRAQQFSGQQGMPQAPTQQQIGQPNQQQEAQRALQQFRPGMGMFGGMM